MAGSVSYCHYRKLPALKHLAVDLFQTISYRLE